MINVQNEKKQHKLILLSSICLGLLINSNFIISFVSEFVSIKNIYAYFYLIICFICILINGNIKIPSKKGLVTLIVLLVQLLFGLLFIKSETSTRFFLCFCCIAIPTFFIGKYKFSIDIVIKTIIFTSIISIYKYFKIFSDSINFSVYNAGEQMGIAYSVLPAAMASLYSLFHMKRKKVLLIVCSIGSLFLSVWTLFLTQTRGAYICLAVFSICFLFINEQNNKTKKIFLYFASIIFVILLFTIFNGMISGTEWYQNTFGYKHSNFLNGREADIELIFSQRNLLNILFGNGIGSVKQITNFEYIHNLFGHVLFEQGLYSSIFVIAILVSSCICLVKKNKASLDYKLFILLFLCASCLRLMVSYYYWIDGIFWLYLSFELNDTFLEMKGGKLWQAN